MTADNFSFPGSPLIMAFILAMVTGCASAADMAVETRSDAQITSRAMSPPTGRILISAHRGCHSFHPENSIAAFNYCAEIGVEVGEIDFTMTADNQLIVFHDEVMERMTDGHGRPYELTFDQVRAVHLRSGDGGEDSAATKERIPILAEVAAAVDPELFFMVDIKTTPIHTREQILEEVVRQATALGMHDRMLWMVNTPRQLEIVNTGSNSQAIIMPSVRRFGQLEGADLGDLIDAERVFGAQVLYLNPGDEDWFSAQSAMLGNRDLHTFGYNRVDPETDALTAAKGWKLLLDLGATAIVTDRPEELAEYLESRGLR